jgi:pilus assembly protein TadC
MNGLVLAVLGGSLVGLSLALVVVRMARANVDLGEALGRLAPARYPGHTESAAGPEPSGTTERLGAWALRTLPPSIWVRTPVKELALLRTPIHRFYGEKLTYAIVGFVAPAFICALVTVAGGQVPLAIPLAAGLVLAVVMFFLPNYNVLDDSKKARAEFRRALTAYTDLVALCRANGSGTRQSMEAAAVVGDTWVFQRLAEELARSRWSGVPPWDALEALAEDLGLPELDDVADILRMSGTEGAAIYDTLSARSAGMRSAILTTDLAEANAVGERLSIPGSLLGVVFMALLLAPALLRMLAPN